MAFYKVLKTGHFSEARFNEVGAIVEIDENAARVAEERGYLQISTKPVKVAHPVGEKATAKPKAKLKKK